jgi:cell division protein FtsL
MKRFHALEGLEPKLDILREKVSGIEKLTYAILAGIVLTLAAGVVRMFMGV